MNWTLDNFTGRQRAVTTQNRLLSALVFIIVLTGFGCGESSQAKVERAKAGPPQPVAVRADSDDDGIPDAIELSSFDDRANFRRWFAHIAEMQFYRPSDAWNKDQRDCAGLVRFAWREALRRHDRLWFQSISRGSGDSSGSGGGEGYEAVAPDVRAYSLERSPVGEKLFRADYGSFREGDPAGGKFSEFADARTLKNHNAAFISRSRRHAQKADLLFFLQPWVRKFPYHVMIFIGDARHASEGAGDWVVYHTGASPGDEGEVKKVRLATLDHHPDKRWRPVENNPNFLGFYRLLILE